MPGWVEAQVAHGCCHVPEMDCKYEELCCNHAEYRLMWLLTGDCPRCYCYYCCCCCCWWCCSMTLGNLQLIKQPFTNCQYAWQHTTLELVVWLLLGELYHLHCSAEVQRFWE
jgi:hypothetical protein